MLKMSMMAIALLVAGCGKGDKATEKATDTSVGAKEPSKDPAAPAANKPAADLFTGTTVTLPGPVEKLTFGMAEADAKTAAPDVFAEKYGYKVPGFEGVKVNVQIENAKVFSIRSEIAQPLETVKGWLEAKWGAPRAEKNSIGAAEYYWSAPATGLRAKLEGSDTTARIYYSPVMSVAQLLGSEPGRFGFEKIALIGASQDEVMTAFAAFNPKPRDTDPGSITMSLPPLEVSEHGSTVDVRVKDGKVTGYTMMINFGTDHSVNEALVARLETLFGKGKPEQGGMYTKFPGPPKVTAEIRKDTGFPSTVWIADHKK